MSEKSEETVHLLTLCSTCEKRPRAEPHPCPYAWELYDDKSECLCCSECTNDCAMDV